MALSLKLMKWLKMLMKTIQWGLEDINQNESESEESKSDTSAEYKDDAVSRLERVKKKLDPTN